MSGLGTPDFFYREAQRLGYVARSAFKVACQNLGPLKTGGGVVGIDLKKVKVPSVYCDSRVQTVSADVVKLSRDKVMAMSPQGKGFSVILSDMCPSVSGISTKDAALSIELGMRALCLALGRGRLSCLDECSLLLDLESDSGTNVDPGVLKPKGNLVIKLLESEESQGFREVCRKHFQKASWLRPKATRSSSKEIYLVCQGLVKAQS